MTDDRVRGGLTTKSSGSSTGNVNMPAARSTDFKLPRGRIGREIAPEDLLGALNDLERKNAPKTLYVAGPLGLPLTHPRVAIIGTRTPSHAGLSLAAEISSMLARQSVAVVSGLARGIDTIAHQEAIRAGGHTVAVLGTPLSRTYPRENSTLQEVIMSDHLAVSQFGEGQAVTPKNFILRNRTMALVADASVIVESGDGGGSLSQGWEALRLGRPLFIHHREFERPELKWPREMSRYGAVEFKDPTDILESIPSASLTLAVAAFDTA